MLQLKNAVTSVVKKKMLLVFLVIIVRIKILLLLLLLLLLLSTNIKLEHVNRLSLAIKHNSSTVGDQSSSGNKS